MQHLDDALIAEWVDGAIDEGSTRHAAIAAHVDQCDECRARVEEERALAGHVRQLLGVAAPPERIPAFEEVLHRAGATPKRAKRPLVRMRHLAWAATVVIAGGVGWYARGIVIATPMGRTVPAVAADQVGTTIAPEPTEPTGAAGVAPERDAPAEEGLASAARPAEAATEARDAGVADAERRRAMEAETGRREAMVDEAHAFRERVAARRDAAPPAAPAVAAPQPLAQAVVAENEVRLQKAAELPPWLTTTRADAERALGHALLVVPELSITGIEITADSSAVRVRQELGNGTTLELIQSRAPVAEGLAAGAVSAEPRARASRAAGAVETVIIDGIRVTARAQVSADSLRRLLGNVGARGGARGK